MRIIQAKAGNTKREKTDYAIQAVAHALDLLEQFSDEISELGVAELSKRLKHQKDYTARLIATLEGRGYLDQNRLTQNCRLGLKTLEISQTFIRHGGLLSRARPVLKELTKACDETSLLAVLKQNFIVYLHAAESSQAVRIVPKVGIWLPAHCSAAGKVQLANLPGNSWENALSGEPLLRYTSNTITDREQFKLQVEEIALRGYALDLEEMDPDVRCVAAPVRDHNGLVAGAVSISGPAWRFSRERLEQELIPLNCQAASEISTRLGYRECFASGGKPLS